MDARLAYERACREFEEMSFSDRVKFVKQSALLKHKYNLIKYDGYVSLKYDFAISRDEGESYVYLWKHMDGDIFYVGSGQGERYKNKHGRSDDFFKHIDKGDAVVYMILSGVDVKTARFYERYLSGSLGLADCVLANKDNNILYIGEGKFNRWLKDNKSDLDNELTSEIENVIINRVLIDHDFRASHFYSIQAFREECGDDWFSSRFGEKEDEK